MTSLIEELLEAQISNVDPDDGDTIINRWRFLVKKHDTATIERCAQVAERMARRIEALSHQDDASRLVVNILYEAAAAIRALKDA